VKNIRVEKLVSSVFRLPHPSLRCSYRVRSDGCVWADASMRRVTSRLAHWLLSFCPLHIEAINGFSTRCLL